MKLRLSIPLISYCILFVSLLNSCDVKTVRINDEGDLRSAEEVVMEYYLRLEQESLSFDDLVTSDFQSSGDFNKALQYNRDLFSGAKKVVSHKDSFSRIENDPSKSWYKVLYEISDSQTAYVQTFHLIDQNGIILIEGMSFE